MGPVADRVNILSVFLQCDRHFICNHTASEYSPLISFIVRFSYRIYFAQSGSSLPL